MRRLLIPLLLCLAAPAAAQNPFAPVARVGDRAVTGYELDQRVLFNQALNAPGDLEALSLDQLIDDRLRLVAAELAGIDPPEEEVTEGMAEFASRANLSLEEFTAAIAEDGVAVETFREFVRAGLAFRQTVQARYGASVEVTEADIDKALALVEPTGRLEAELSEIILPADGPEREAESRRIAAQLRTIRSFDAFADAARQVSFAATRDAGGRLEPLPLERLPGPIQEELLRLSPGEVSSPIAIPDALVVFQLRALREVDEPPEPPQAIDYAAFYIPGGRSQEGLAQAAAIDAAVDTCDDLYGIARGLPPQRLERGTRSVDAIPADVAAQLALLDPNEASVALTRAGGRTLVYLMLCQRDPLPEAEAEVVAAPIAPDGSEGQVAGEGGEDAASGPPSREQVRSAIRNSRLQSFADAYIDELRAEVGVEVLVQP